MSPAKKRRQYGTGSVYQRTSDGRWIGKAQVGWTAQGTRRVITVSCSAADGKAECTRRLREKQRQIEREGVPEARAKTTVKTWSETWLAERATRLRPKGYGSASAAVKAHIIPAIGHRPLESLTPADVRAVHKHVRSAGLSQSSLRNAHWQLTAMLRAAALEGHAVPPRVLLVEAPEHGTSDREGLPPEDVAKLIPLILDDPLAARWLAALINGMRQGECLGLTWPMIDFTPTDGAPYGVIDVCWQLQSLPYIDPKNNTLGFRVPDDHEAAHLLRSYHLVRPKTGRGRRIIPMVEPLSLALAHWRGSAPENPWGLVWTGADNRWGDNRPTVRRPTVDREQWEALQARAGIEHPAGRPYTMHEARNTAATVFLELGADPKVVEQIMGHTSIMTTRGYQKVRTRLMSDVLTQAATKLIEG